MAVRESVGAAFTYGIHEAYLVTLCLAGVGVLVGMFAIARSQSQAPEAARPAGMPPAADADADADVDVDDRRLGVASVGRDVVEVSSSTQSGASSS
jgi:hypothetical protein